jgi:hypothetical protein
MNHQAFYAKELVLFGAGRRGRLRSQDDGSCDFTASVNKDFVLSRFRLVKDQECSELAFC